MVQPRAAWAQQLRAQGPVLPHWTALVQKTPGEASATPQNEAGRLGRPVWQDQPGTAPAALPPPQRGEHRGGLSGALLHPDLGSQPGQQHPSSLGFSQEVHLWLWAEASEDFANSTTKSWTQNESGFLLKRSVPQTSRDSRQASGNSLSRSRSLGCSEGHPPCPCTGARGPPQDIF